MSDFDISENAMRNRQQSSRRVELPFTLDFTLQAVAAGESAKIGTLPKGFVFEGLHMWSETAEGVTATFDIGTEADVDALSDGANANLAAGLEIPVGGSPAITAGYKFDVNTDLVVAGPAAAATLDDAVISGVIFGYFTHL